MAELRRLLIEPHRMKVAVQSDMSLLLLQEELHYLCRVIRLRENDCFNIIDGQGNLWVANLNRDSKKSSLVTIQTKKEFIRKPSPSIGLAVVLPKRGFDDVLRMTSEIGVDIIQPLFSERCFSDSEGSQKRLRWLSIIRESVEQSERLWLPELCETTSFDLWLQNIPKQVVVAFAKTRMINGKELNLCLDEITNKPKQVWIVIGPEGGWTKNEESIAKETGCEFVQFGTTIMRTSTAAIAAIQLITTWRRLVSFS